MLGGVNVGSVVGLVVGCLTAGSDLEVQFEYSMDGKAQFYLPEGTNNVWVEFNMTNTNTKESLQDNCCCATG